MVCLECGAKTAVINSRLQKRSNSVWRRRQCRKCQAIFTTQELPLYELAWTVKDKKGHIKPFSRDKLLISLSKSCAHRSSALTDAASLTDTVIKRLIQEVKQSNLTSQQIKQIALVTLNRFDTPAATHYQAYHP